MTRDPAPAGWRLVSQQAVKHPQGGYGLLIQNQRTGIYCLHARTGNRSIEQQYAFMHADLGARIKTLRIKAGLSQEQLAGLTGMSKTGVANWEQGARRPSPALMALLQDIIGLEDWPGEA